MTDNTREALYELLDHVLTAMDKKAVPTAWLAIVDAAGKDYIGTFAAANAEKALEWERRARNNFEMIGAARLRDDSTATTAAEAVAPDELRAQFESLAKSGHFHEWHEVREIDLSKMTRFEDGYDNDVLDAIWRGILAGQSFRLNANAAEATPVEVLMAEQVEQAAEQSGFKRIHSCCDVPQKFCNSDVWQGELRAFGLALLRTAALPATVAVEAKPAVGSTLFFREYFAALPAPVNAQPISQDKALWTLRQISHLDPMGSAGTAVFMAKVALESKQQDAQPVSGALDEMKEFEVLAKFQGLQDFTKAADKANDGEIPSTHGGKFCPATYYNFITELAYRVWANKDAALSSNQVNAAQPSVESEVVAWMRDSREGCITAKSKRQMENANFGVWGEIAKSYTIPLGFIASPLPVQNAAQPEKDAVQLGEKLFSFVSLSNWVNRSSDNFSAAGVPSSQIICIDSFGRICGWGEHFKQAEEDGSYPINAYRIRENMPPIAKQPETNRG